MYQCDDARERGKQKGDRPVVVVVEVGIPAGFGAASGSRRLGTMPTRPRSQENANIYKELFFFKKSIFAVNIHATTALFFLERVKKLHVNILEEKNFVTRRNQPDWSTTALSAVTHILFLRVKIHMAIIGKKQKYYILQKSICR